MLPQCFTRAPTTIDSSLEHTRLVPTRSNRRREDVYPGFVTVLPRCFTRVQKTIDSSLEHTSCFNRVPKAIDSTRLIPRISRRRCESCNCIGVDAHYTFHEGGEQEVGLSCSESVHRKLCYGRRPHIKDLGLCPSFPARRSRSRNHSRE